MAEQQTIKYAPQWTNMTVDNVIFQTNNMMCNFNYPPNVPTYKPIMNFLRNYPLYNAFTNYPLVVYQNFLREFWSTAVAFDPFPSTDEPEKCLLKEFLIKFLVLNRQRPLTLDFHTFCSSTGLDYNTGKYVAHPTLEVVKKELGKIAINLSYLDKTPVLKNSFPVAWRMLFTFVIQVLDENYSSTEQVNSIQQLLAYSLITGTEVDIGEIIYSDLVTKLLNKSRMKYVSYPRFISCALQVLLGTGAKYQTFADIQAYMLFEDDLDKESDEEEVLVAGDDMDEDIQAAEEVRTPLPKQDQHEPSQTQEFASDSSSPGLKKFDNIHPLTERQLIKYLRKVPYYDENIAPKDQSDKLVEASISSFDRSITTISDLYKGLDVITQLLKDINNAVKDDPAANQKINEATETFIRISSNITEVLSLVKGFDFSKLVSTVKDLQAHALKQEEA
ncbi:hypothetical protein Tco_0886316 [Tanacetum coccineum]